MAPNIFMSYSRRETGFVDDLTHRLEKAGFNIWLDYRVLVPGTPWAGQIDKGLREADVILFVVSKESLSSPYVELEWRRGLNDKKRIVLVLFEAIPLPPELQGLEWVDFRSNYKRALKQLSTLLNSPEQKMRPVPQSGFKAPLAIWFTAALALFVGGYSLFAFWTILLPLILVPFTWRVFTRSYNFQQVQNALWALPIGLIFSLGLLMEFNDINISTMSGMTALAISSQVCGIPLVIIALSMLLRSAALQRWGKPEANMPLFANPYHPTNTTPAPIPFFIDHAPQDRLFAKDIAKGLTQYGHSPAADIQSADVVFVLISRFKTDTEADPEQKVVFPVLVQTAQPSEKLSHVQWIDYRKGLRGLSALAQLLPNPAKLLAALSVRPSNGAQIVTPNIITTMINFLTVIIVIDFGALLTYPLELLSSGLADVLTSDASSVAFYLFVQAICLMVAGVLIYFMVKALRERRGWFASIPAFLLGQFLTFITLGIQTSTANDMDSLLISYGIASKAIFPGIPFIFFTLGAFFINFAALIRINDIRRWFPAKVK